MTQRLYLLSTIALASVLATAAASAQEAPPPEAPRARMRMHEPGTGLQEGVTPMRRQVGRAGWVRGGGGPGARALLQHREFLALTEEQVTRLEAMHESFAEQQTARAAALKAQREELRSLMEQDSPDAAAIRAATKARLDLEQEGVLAHLDAATAVRAVLTADQQTKWRGFEAGVRTGMRGGRGMRSSRGGRGLDRSGYSGHGRARADMRRMPRMQQF